MSYTYEEITTALSAFVSAPEGAVDYKVGDKSFKNSQQAKLLLDQAKFLAEHPVGDFETATIDVCDVDEFGINHTQKAVPN